MAFWTSFRRISLLDPLKSCLNFITEVTSGTVFELCRLGVESGACRVSSVDDQELLDKLDDLDAEIQELKAAFGLYTSKVRRALLEAEAGTGQ